MNFELAGPFKLKCYRGVVKKKESREHLLKDLIEWDEDLPSAHGCYVFAIRAGKGWTPYYAGQALRRTIFAEATHVDKLQKYNEVLADYERGTPVLFFLPWATDGGERYRRLTRRSSPTLDFLEDWLISLCYRRNDKLINIARTKILKSIHVQGVLNATPGDWSAGSVGFRKMFQL